MQIQGKPVERLSKKARQKYSERRAKELEKEEVFRCLMYWICPVCGKDMKPGPLDCEDLVSGEKPYGAKCCGRAYTTIPTVFIG